MKLSSPHTRKFEVRQWCGVVLAPVFLLITLFVIPPENLSQEGWRTGGVALAMAALWVSEAIPIPVTALLPLILFPFFGVMHMKDSAMPYANPIIFLFMGGFLIAIAIQRWNLHKRLALSIIAFMGTKPSRIIGGFMLATALLSMWVSNTSTVLMLYPIGMSIIALLEKDLKGKASDEEIKGFATALMLGIAFSGSIGGIATLIGTPPNALLAGFLFDNYNIQIGFVQWMLFALPLTAVTLPLTYFILTRISFKVMKSEAPTVAKTIKKDLQALGPITYAEKVIICVIFGTALLWIFRPLIDSRYPLVSDAGIAMLGGLVLFLVPVNLKRRAFIMDWEDTKKLPWGILILFGGGLSLAAAIQGSGLASYIGTLVSGLDTWHHLPILLLIVGIVLLLTEINSNTATVSTFLPIGAVIAVGLGESPLLFAIPIALVGSCAFMLPVATPPNAIVFGSGKVRLSDMVRAGIWINVLFFILIPIFTYTLGRHLFDF